MSEYSGPGGEAKVHHNGLRSPASSNTEQLQLVEIPCPQCGQVVQGDWQLCPYCGQPVPKDPIAPNISCPGCDEQIESDWQLCPRCGYGLSTVIEDPAIDEARGVETQDRPRVAGSYGIGLAANEGIAGEIFMGCALILAVVSLFLPWGSSTASKSLASEASNLLYNIPFLIVLAAAIVLRRVDTTRRASVAVSLLVSVWWVVSLSSDVIGTITHHATLGPGAKLGVTGAVLALLATAIAISWAVDPFRVRIGVGSLVWAAGSAALAVTWVVGEWLPWQRNDLHSNVTSYVFKGSGTHDLVTSCCTAFRNQTMPNNVREALTMGLVVVAAFTVAFLIPRQAGGIALIGVGILYLADPLSWLARIAQSNVNPLSLGAPRNDILSGQLTASVSGLPGGWIALTAAFCLVALGVFRLLSSFAVNGREHQSTVHQSESRWTPIS